MQLGSLNARKAGYRLFAGWWEKKSLKGGVLGRGGGRGAGGGELVTKKECKNYSRCGATSGFNFRGKYS